MAKVCVSVPPLNKRARIISATTTGDGQGGQAEVWAVVATVWAAFEPYTGRERIQAGQVQTPVSHRVHMRYRTGLTTSLRLLYDSRVFEIAEVINIAEANSYLKLLCIETKPKGLWENLVSNWEDINSNWETP